MKHIFDHQHIGIWGFGIVGSSALSWLIHHVEKITVLNKGLKPTSFPQDKHIFYLEQTNEQSIHDFLNQCDVIIASPGINLAKYTPWHDKFICEADIIQMYFHKPVIALTGSLGKTSTTTLLAQTLQLHTPHTVAAGNIGTGMLNLLEDTTVEQAVLELSSFQLEHTKIFAPKLAIWTNFYENHLDFHANMHEYFMAKAHIFLHQKEFQQALLPIEIFDMLMHAGLLKPNMAFFALQKPDTELLEKLDHHPIYALTHQRVIKIQNGLTTELIELPAQLPTFAANVALVSAALDLLHLDQQYILDALASSAMPAHRLEHIATIRDCKIYNDSKATVWQATWQAILSFGTQPIQVFIGGLSKGVDRTPLFKNIMQHPDCTVHLFGQERFKLAEICKQLSITHTVFETIDESFINCINNVSKPSIILFSPSGSSYDQFTNFQARGDHFTQLVQDLN